MPVRRAIACVPVSLSGSLYIDAWVANHRGSVIVEGGGGRAGHQPRGSCLDLWISGSLDLDLWIWISGSLDQNNSSKEHSLEHQGCERPNEGSELRDRRSQSRQRAQVTARAAGHQAGHAFSSHLHSSAPPLEHTSTRAHLHSSAPPPVTEQTC